MLTNLRGIAADGLLTAEGGLSAIDDQDYRDWLATHGAAPETIESPLIRGLYDLVFAYEGGDPQRPRFSAGVGLQLATRMFLDYKGAIFWHMQAGMGEVIFAPIYEVLQRRGVSFRFFHRVDHLGLSEDGRRIDSVHLTRQAELAHGREDYEPLVRVKDLPCWPVAPLAAQLGSSAGAGRGPGVPCRRAWRVRGAARRPGLRRCRLRPLRGHGAAGGR